MLPLRWSASALSCALLLAVACDERVAPAPAGSTPADRDDDGTIEDEGDGGSEPAGLYDGGAPEPAPGEELPSAQGCSLVLQDHGIVAETFVSPDDPLALAVRNEGAMLSWVAYENGKRKVTPMWFSQSTSDVTESLLSNSDSIQLEPASAATREGFLSVWSDDQTGSFDLFAQHVNAMGVSGDVAAPVRLTENDDDDRSPVVAEGSDGNLLVAWRAELGAGEGRTLLLDNAGQPQASARDIPGLGAIFGRPALSALGDGYLLAWVDDPSRQVRLQRLSAQGAPLGSFARADMDGNAEGHLELTTSEVGGALAFDVRMAGERAEVRFRALDAMGRLIGSEHALSEYPERGLMPSIAAFRGGYAVAFRSTSEDQTVLRVVFVDAQGTRLSTIEVASLRDLDLPTVLRVSPDGTRIFLAWTDRVQDADAYELRRAWLRCDPTESSEEGSGL